MAEEKGWLLRDEHFQKGALGRGEALRHLIPGIDRPIPDGSSGVPNDRCGCLHPNPTLGPEQLGHQWQIPERGSARRTEQEKRARQGERGQRSGAVCHPPPGAHTPSKSQRNRDPF